MRTILVATAFAILSCLPGAAQSVRFGMDAAYEPWSFLDDDDEIAGFEPELAKALCARGHIDCQFVVTEWAQILPQLMAGQYDAILAAMTVTEERAATLIFTAEYYPPSPSRFVVKTGFGKSVAPPTGLIIGVQSGTIYEKHALDEFHGDNVVIPFSTADAALTGLYLGTVDAILADGLYLAPIVAGSNGGLRLAGSELLIGGGVAMGLRPGDEALKARLDHEIAALKADGTLDALISKWFDTGPYYLECANDPDC